MNELTIELSNGLASFEPADEVNGTVAWVLGQQVSMELRLFWFTRGKGTEDVGIIKTIRFDQPSSRDKKAFNFSLPDSPYSFSGKLISLIWAMELIAEPSNQVARREIVLAPGGSEIRLDSLPSHEKAKSFFGWRPTRT
jgi:hypothetical protein